MFRFTRPSVEEIRAYLDRQRHEPFSYPEVGETRSLPPTGYDFDQAATLLGHGRTVFENACAAIRNWRMFPRLMTRLFWPDTFLEPGNVVAVLFRAGPIWSLNPARIVYTMDEATPVGRVFGFAYGTLRDHVEQGEERFQVTWDAATDAVTYKLNAFSRPQHLLAQWSYAYVRAQQARFRRLSCEAMEHAVSRRGEGQPLSRKMSKNTRAIGTADC